MVVTMLYAIIGIPLTLLTITNLGRMLATAFRFVYRNIFIICCCCSRRRKPETQPLHVTACTSGSQHGTSFNPWYTAFSRNVCSVHLCRCRRKTFNVTFPLLPRCWIWAIVGRTALCSDVITLLPWFSASLFHYSYNVFYCKFCICHSFINKESTTIRPYY